MNSGLSLRYILPVSFLVLIPCFWQSRIQSADFASHIYNAWLASQVERGELPGLYIVPQWTNVLFDLMLVRFLVWFGPEWAQRVAVSIAVLVFFWGSLAAVRAMGRRSPLHIVLILAMFSYGFVFRMGLFNFYLGMGFGFAALAVLWHKPSLRWLWALPLVALVFLSHVLAAGWLLPVSAYIWIAKSLRPRYRLLLFGSAAVVILCGALFAMFGLPSAWLSNQVLFTTGAEQTVLFGDEYKAIMVALILFQLTLFAALIEKLGLWRLALSLPFQMAILHGLALALVPSKIELPGFGATFSLFTERVGLAQAVVACGLLALAPEHRLHKHAAAGLLAVFLLLSYRDSSRLNAIEDQLQSMVRSLPARSRVVSGLCYPGRINAAFHLLDRACIGHCFSFGNYEPASGHFRLRVRPGNHFVVSDYLSANSMEYGGYRFEERDFPLRLFENQSGKIRLAEIEVGQRSQRACPAPPR
jgi:hypothetical protein